MEEILLKTHPIVTDVHEEYEISWTGRILDTDPMIKDGMPVFVVIGSEGRIELNTTDMKRVEKCAKSLTRPRGRGATTTDHARIYLKEKNGNQVLMGTLTHHHVKSYRPMYDRFCYY